MLFNGENGCGKSTVIDAINLVLTGSKQFNSASDKSSRGSRGRNIASAIHNVDFQNTNSDGKELILRDGPVIAYIILEFYNETTGDYFLNGIQMSSEKYDRLNPKVKEIYFRYKNKNLDQIKDDIYSSDPKKINILKTKDSNLKTFTNKEDAFQEFFTNRKMRAYNVKDYEKRNNRVLKAKLVDSNGRLLSPNEFVKKYVLPEPNSDARNNINTFRNQKEALNNIEITLSSYKKRETMLKNMLLSIDSLYKLLDKKECLKGSTIYKQILKIENKIEEKRILISSLEKKKQQLDFDYEKVKMKRQNAQEEKESLQIAMQSKDSPYKSELIRLNDKISALEKEEAVYVKLLNDISRNLDIIDVKDADSITQSDISYYIDELNQRLELLRDTKYRYNVKGTELNEKKNSFKHELENLENGYVSPENLDVIEFKNHINEILGTNYHLLYEMIDQIDPDWQCAIEGFLGKRRYALLVSEEHLTTVLKEQKKYKNVIVARIKKQEKLIENNAASKVVIKNNDRLARMYIDYILGNVMLCNSEKELKEAKVGLMTDGRTSNSTMYENRSIDKLKLICGLEAINQEKNRINEELRHLYDELSDLAQKSRENRDLIERLETFVSNLTKNSSINFNVEEELLEFKNKRDSLIKEMEKSRDYKEYKELQERFNAVKVEYEELFQKEQKLIEEKGSLVANIHSNQANISEYNDELKELNIKYQPLYDDDKIKKFYSTLSSEDINRLDEEVELTENEIQNIRKKIERTQDNYMSEVKTFQPGYKKDDYERIKKEYEQLHTDNIPETIEAIKKQKKNFEQSRDIFFYTLLNNYKDVRYVIKQMNAKLKTTKLGDDFLRIDIGINSEFGKYLECIEHVYNNGTDNIDKGSEYELLVSYFNETINKSEEEIDQRCDYRNYLKTEVKLIRKTHEGESTRSLEKDNLSNSGGQEQTPYYVILAISLLTVFGEDDGFKLIMLDEAFGKMDDQRAESVVKFFNTLGLQVILSTYRNLSSIVNMTIIFNRYSSSKVQIIQTRYDKNKGENVLIGTDNNKENNIKQIA